MQVEPFGDEFDQYDFGMFDKVADSGLLMQLCFSHNPDEETRFSGHIGSLKVYGPGPEYVTAVCTAGISCKILVHGDVQLTSVAMITPAEPCGTGLPEAALGTANAVLRYPFELADGSKQFNAGIIDNFSQNLYFICWGPTQDLQSESRSWSLPVTIGQLIVHGPPESEYDCILGLMCVVNLQGLEMPQTSVLKVISWQNDCAASSSLYNNFQIDGLDSEVQQMQLQNSGAGVFEIGRASGGPGEYRLCWTGHLHESPVDVGKLEMRGPNKLNVRCQLGSYCKVVLDGFGLNDLNQLFYIPITQECEDAVLSEQDAFWAKPTDGIIFFFDPILDAAGGTHRLCWTSSIPVSLMDFHNGESSAAASQKASPAVELGEIVLVGPGPIDDLQLVLGNSQFVEVPGTGFTSSDQVSIVDGPCHNDDPRPDLVFGQYPDVHVQDVSVAGDRLTVRISPIVHGSVSGEYYLCWHGSNADPSENGVTISGIELTGPLLTSRPDDLLCKLGRDCVMDIVGSSIGEQSRVLVVEGGECPGDTSSHVSLSQFGNSFRNPTPVVFPNAINSDHGVVDFRWISAGDVFGEYVICWGDDPSSQFDYNVKLTNLELSGPIPVSAKCRLGLKCHVIISGRNLDLSDDLLLSIGTECVDISSGLSALVEASQAVTGATDPVYGLTELVFDFGVPAYTLTDDFYLCYNSTAGHGEKTDDANHYLVSVGQLEFEGAMHSDRVQDGMVAGFSSLVTASGRELLSSDRLALFKKPCEDSINQRVSDIVSPRTVSQDGNIATFDLNSDMGGHVYACWCGNKIFGKCVEHDEFSIQIFTAMVKGPESFSTGSFVGDDVAVAGREFNLTVQGHQLLANDQIALTGEDEPCVMSDLELLDTLYDSETGELSTALTYIEPTEQNICWCHGPTGSHGAGCQVLGLLTIVGPMSTISAQANAGDLFYASLEGRGLAESFLRVVPVPWSCPDPREDIVQSLSPLMLPPFFQEGSGPATRSQWDRASWNNVVIMVAGEYTICWAAAPQNGSAPQDNHFLVQVGIASINGVVGFIVDEVGSSSAVASYGFTLSPTYHQYIFVTTDRIRFTQDVCSESNDFSVSSVSPSSGGTYDGILYFPGWYNVCWCGFAKACNTGADFNIQFANQILIKGLAHLQHIWTTIPSDGWILQLPANGPVDVTNGISLRAVDDSCAIQDAAHPFVSAESSDDTLVTWPGVAVQAGVYSACWCETGGSDLCAQNIHGGYVFVAAISSIDLTSSVGVPAPLVLHGVLTMNNRVYISRNSCSSNVDVIELIAPTVYLKSNDGYDLPEILSNVTIPEVMFNHAGTHTVCWCDMDDICSELYSVDIEGPSSWQAMTNGEPGASVQTSFDIVMDNFRPTGQRIHIIDDSYECDGNQVEQKFQNRFKCQNKFKFQKIIPTFQIGIHL